MPKMINCSAIYYYMTGSLCAKMLDSGLVGLASETKSWVPFGQFQQNISAAPAKNLLAHPNFQV